ncbi:MAG: KpsF/GutQ family sugar-phosphate isomerase [Pseudomonadales bacterium]|nr:KpsF/GutQ family sugar-phosphate isomerase [Pseudomonadales bacterium]
MTKHAFIESGQRTVRLEQQAIEALHGRIDSHFSAACETLLACTGRVVVTGMGKSGHIANKIAATLASTGTPAFFMHPGEASHGDLGMLTSSDVVIALSGSGTTNEVITLLPLIKRIGASLIAMTGNSSSTLSLAADVHLDVQVEEEACPLGLAPTSSTTATLVMGDALAVALLEARGFSAEDFAFSHPGGTLGKRLLLKVSDVMQNDFPQVSPDTLLSDALMEITQKGLGMTTIINSNGTLAGIFTDGDLRRALDKRQDLHTTAIIELMTADCKTVHSDMLAAEALNIMEKNNISTLVVINKDNTPCAVVHIHTLIKAGLA